MLENYPSPRKIGKLYLYLALLFFTLVLGCKRADSYSEKTENLNKLLKSIDSSHESLSSKIYFVTPLEGCYPCINKMLKFAIENAANKNIKVIVSGVGRKDMKLKLASQEFEIEDYLIDDSDYAKRLNLVNGYPCIYYCQNDNVVKFKIINPENFKEELFVEENQ